MTDTMTSTDERKHPDIAPMITPLTVVDVDDLEVCNTEVGERFECFELGPFAGNVYLRVRTADTAALVARLHTLLDDAATAAADEADRLAPRCVCGERIAPDDDDCGAERCAVELVGA